MRTFCLCCEKAIESTPDDVQMMCDECRRPRPLTVRVRCSCGDLIGYAPEEGLTSSGALCGNCAAGRADRELIEEALDLLVQFHEPDAGQLRTQTQRDIDEWLGRANAWLGATREKEEP